MWAPTVPSEHTIKTQKQNVRQPAMSHAKSTKAELSERNVIIHEAPRLKAITPTCRRSRADASPSESAQRRTVTSASRTSRGGGRFQGFAFLP